MGTWIVGTIVAAAIGTACYKIYRDHKNGKGCGNCEGCKNCPKSDNNGFQGNN